MELDIIEWRGDYHLATDYERAVMEGQVVAKPENDVLFISGNHRELLFAPAVNRAGVLVMLHATACGHWVEKVMLDNKDATLRCRAIIVSPYSGGGSMLAFTGQVSVDTGEPEVVLVSGRMQVQFKERAPLNSHSYFKKLFDGENPRNHSRYTL